MANIQTLPNWRKESDATFRVKLKDGGVAADWSGFENIKAYLYSNAQRVIAGKFSVSLNESDSTILVCNYSATAPQYLGLNSIVIRATYHGRNKTYDAKVANIVSRTDEVPGNVSLDDPVVDVEIVVEDMSSSILDNAVAAALDAAAKAEAAAELGLSAAEGKRLSDDIDVQGAKVAQEQPFVVDITDVDLTPANLTLRNYYIDSSTLKYTTNSGYKHIILRVQPGDRVYLKANASYNCVYAWFNSSAAPTADGLPQFADGYTERLSVSAGTDTIITVPETATYLYVYAGATTSNYPYLPQAVRIMHARMTSADKQIYTEHTYTGANLLDPDKIRTGFAVDEQNGGLMTAGSNRGASDYIPVSSGLVCNCYTSYGSYGKAAVYDANKDFLRALNSGIYSYQEGDGFVRWTIDMSASIRFVVAWDGNPNFGASGLTIPYVQPLVQKVIDPSAALSASQVPDLLPAFGFIGQPGLRASADSLSGGYVRLTDAPQRLKARNASLSFFAKISAFGYVEIGGGYANATGWAIRVDAANVSARGYNNGSSYAINTKAHGLTIDTFLYIAVVKTQQSISVKITSIGGAYAGSVSLNFDECYGYPFAYVDGNSSLTDVQFGWVSPDLRRPVWLVGDSYMSMYPNRWPQQLVSTFGVDDFAVIAEAGNKSADIFPSLTAALNFGTPKYLVWGPGMNDTNHGTYYYYIKRVELLCQAKGITLVPCTIPWPSGGSKASINNIIKASGHRYIDVYAAVSSDDNGAWYEGFCDDGTHPTVLGAKAIAARVMLDLPEILDY